MLVTMAGPAMNLVLAVGLVALARVADCWFDLEPMAELCCRCASLSLLLCFFNLIPIPPLDGSHVLRILIGMSYETYWHLSRFGFIGVILVMQIPRCGRRLALCHQWNLGSTGNVDLGFSVTSERPDYFLK